MLNMLLELLKSPQYFNIYKWYILYLQTNCEKSRFRDKIKLSGYIHFLRILNAITLDFLNRLDPCVSISLLHDYVSLLRFHINFQIPCFFLK